MTHEAQTRLPWTAEEDAILISLVERYGEKRWNMVANGLPGRTGKGCSHRWRTYLRPDVKHPHLEPFTEWEAATIVQAQREMGNNWLAIAKLLLPGRSNTAVKNFWHCRLKSGSGTNTNRFIVEGYSLRYLLSEVPHEERIHPVALPAFPSTAPTGQLHKQEQHMVDLNQLAHNPSLMPATAGQDTLTAQAFSTGLDPMDMTGGLMGLNPAAAGLPAGLGGASAAPPVAIPPPDPTADPKEDLKRRASAYVQQQLARLGQPASKAGGSSSRRDSAPHTGSHSHHVGSTGSAAHAHPGWPGAGGEVFSMGGSGAVVGPPYRKGSGRGRGRRPGQRNRYSSDDDPNDETYVPSGRYIKTEQHVTSRDEGMARHSDPSAASSSMTQAYLHGSSEALRHGMASSSAAMSQQHMLHNSMTATGECHYSIHGMQQQQQYYEPDHAAAATGHHHTSEGGAITSAALYFQQQQQQQQHYQQQPGLADSAAIAAARAQWQDARQDYTMHVMSASHPASASGIAPASYHHPSHTAAGATAAGGPCITTTAATVAAALKRPSLLGLEDTAVAYEAFRQSGDFKVSIGCLDELLSGGAGHHGGSDWNGVAGLFRGTSLDGSRFSLTGSADAAGGAPQHVGCRSSRGGACASTMPPPPRQQQQQQCQQLTQQESMYQQQHQQEQQQQQLLRQQQVQMPPPGYQQVAGHMSSTMPSTNQYSAAVEAADMMTNSYNGVPKGPHDHSGSTDVISSHTANAVKQEPAGGYGVTSGASQSFVTHGPNPEGGRCESPFKAAALQQPPFSPALKDGKPSSAPGFASSQTAPSSQPSQCPAGNMLSHLQHGHLNNLPSTAAQQQHQQQQQQTEGMQPAATAVHQNQCGVPKMPATFHNVLQALGGSGSSSSRCHAAPPPAVAGTSSQGQAVKLEEGVSIETAAKSTTAGTAVEGAGLQLHCMGDVMQRRSRASFGLLSPVGNIFADATEGCLTLDDAMGKMVAIGSNGDNSTQTRAERRSLRMLLGVLASSPEHPESLAWVGPTAPAADTATLNAAGDLTFMRRSSHGGGLAGSSYTCKPGDSSSSGRLSLSVLPPTGRVSHRGGPAVVGGLGGADLGFGECQKRSRVSLTLTSPVGGAAKRARVSFAGGMSGRVSSGTAEYDDCLAYWQN